MAISNNLREWAQRQFDNQKSRPADKSLAAERETAAGVIRAKTERLKALRLAKEAADKVPAENDATETLPGGGEKA